MIPTLTGSCACAALAAINGSAALAAIDVGEIQRADKLIRRALALIAEPPERLRKHLERLDQAVNTTVGLPFIRTSPDHGTAFDIAGQGIARPDSMVAAINLAIDLTIQRHLN